MEEQAVNQATTPAGWFADPTGTMRWWDGQSWTDHIAPGAALATLASQPAPASGVSRMAIAALVCGFIPYFGVLAILAGITALDRIKRTGERGRIPAIIGIAFGSLWALNIGLLILKAVTT